MSARPPLRLLRFHPRPQVPPLLEGLPESEALYLAAWIARFQTLTPVTRRSGLEIIGIVLQTLERSAPRGAV